MKRAISPVIATVIIVAVTIAIAIAVALWMSGLVGSFTQVENLQIVSAYATKDDGQWTIHLAVKNVGTTAATIDQVFVNGKPVPSDKVEYGSGSNTIPAGSEDTITITISSSSSGGNTFSSGQMVEVRLHTASGKEYPKMVTLP